MPVRRVKSQLELGLTRPRVFRQWKLGSEPPQFGDLSVTEAQIYLATGADIETLFLHEEHGNHPGFWARTDPVYDPHRLVAHADALNRPYIGVQIAIPAPWVEVTVRYSKQTAQTLVKLGRTSRKGYRAAKKQIRNRREQQSPAVPDPATSCGCGFSDNHRIDHDWIELPRVLTDDGVLHVLRVWPVSVCGQVVSNPDTARIFDPRRHLETEQPWQYCPRCWPIAKRRLLDLFREQMMGVPKSAESLPPPAEPESAQLNKEEASGQMPTFLLTDPKAYLPTILQEAGLISSRDRARAAINDGSVAIEGWPPIAHRHTFKSKDLNGKTLAIGGIPALRFTTQVTADSPERTDS